MATLAWNFPSPFRICNPKAPSIGFAIRLFANAYYAKVTITLVYADYKSAARLRRIINPSWHILPITLKIHRNRPAQALAAEWVEAHGGFVAYIEV